MALRQISKMAERDPRRFYWWNVVPLQSLLLTAFAAPLYGFNAFIQPLNALFGEGATSPHWLGATCGGLALLGAGCGSLFNHWLIKRVGSVSRLLVLLCFVTPFLFVLGALACQLKSIPLLLFGFALPSGLVFSNVYTLCTMHVMGWAGVYKRSGLQSGVIGLGFGLWGAIYSFAAPPLIAQFGLSLVFILSGIGVGVLHFLAWLNLVPAPKPEIPEIPAGGREKSRVFPLQLGQLFRLLPFWLFFFYFLLFLIPGFGFKIIVQVLSTNVFHTGTQQASLIAVAFLGCYGLSRLTFGYVSDKVPTRPLYIGFTVAQFFCLLVAAITLPILKSVVVFTVLMCLVGTAFAAGKCIWMVLLLKIYGKENLHLAMCATLPAYGVAGLIGPVTLNGVLQGGNMAGGTSLWLFAMAGLLAICLVLILMLKRVDYARVSAGRAQSIGLVFKGEGELTRF